MSVCTSWFSGVVQVLQKNSHPVKLIAKKLACPLSPNSMLLLHFAWKGLQKKQPFRFECRNNIDQGGAGGSGVMWPHVGGWLFFLKNPVFTFFKTVLAFTGLPCVQFLSFFQRASERRVLLIVGGLSNIFTSSHLHTTSSNLHIFSSTHPHIFTSAHLHIFSSSHLLIFTSSHLHIFSSSHLLIFTSSHPRIFTSSHLHIFSSSHLHILTSSHLHILTSSHHIFTSSHLHIFSSSHLLIFTSSRLHIFTSSHLHIHSLLPSCSLALLLSCPLALLPSCSLALFFFLLFYFSLKARGSANETARNATLSHETRFDRQKLNSKIAILKCPRQPFRMKWGSIAKKWNCDFEVSATTLSHEMRFDRQKLEWNCDFECAATTLSHETRFDRQKL